METPENEAGALIALLTALRSWSATSHLQFPMFSTTPEQVCLKGPFTSFQHWHSSIPFLSPQHMLGVHGCISKLPTLQNPTLQINT